MFGKYKITSADFIILFIKENNSLNFLCCKLLQFKKGPHLKQVIKDSQ